MLFITRNALDTHIVMALIDIISRAQQFVNLLTLFPFSSFRRLASFQIPPRKIEKPLVSCNMKDLVDQWDVNFIENGETPVVSPSGIIAPPSEAAQEMLFKLLLAANYLNIKSLLQLTCAKVASLLKGKTPNQIRDCFNIRNDFTQAEEEEVRKEYRDLIG